MNDRKTAIEKLKNDIKSGAEQKRGYRAERRQYKERNSDIRQSDRYSSWFRNNDESVRALRVWNRAHHLALAYLRGRTYMSTEMRVRVGNEAWQYHVAHEAATQLQCALDPVPYEQSNSMQRKEDWRHWRERFCRWAQGGVPADLTEPPKCTQLPITKIAAAAA